MTALAVSLTMVFCKKPADNSTKAKVSDAREIDIDAPFEMNCNLVKGISITFIGAKVTGLYDGGFKTFEGHFLLMMELLRIVANKCYLLEIFLVR